MDLATAFRAYRRSPSRGARHRRRRPGAHVCTMARGVSRAWPAAWRGLASRLATGCWSCSRTAMRRPSSTGRASRSGSCSRPSTGERAPRRWLSASRIRTRRRSPSRRPQTDSVREALAQSGREGLPRIVVAAGRSEAGEVPYTDSGGERGASQAGRRR